jgi:hypothetical protein
VILHILAIISTIYFHWVALLLYHFHIFQIQSTISHSESADIQSRSTGSQCRSSDSQNRLPSSRCMSADSQCTLADSHCRSADSQCRSADSQCRSADSHCRSSDSQCRSADSQLGSADSQLRSADSLGRLTRGWSPARLLKLDLVHSHRPRPEDEQVGTGPGPWLTARRCMWHLSHKLVCINATALLHTYVKVRLGVSTRFLVLVSYGSFVIKILHYLPWFQIQLKLCKDVSKI